MAKKVIITGATGLIGKYISQVLSARGDEVTVFTRNPVTARNILPGAKEFIEWSASEEGEWEKHIDGKDAIINLAGEPLWGEIWKDEYKEKIMKSREIGTRGLVNAAGKALIKPEVFVSASAIGIYGGSGDNYTYTENDPPGEGFLPEVSKRWEYEAAQVEQYGIRRVNVRVGIVLDKNEGALEKVLTPFRYFLGGQIGEGTQWISWIHIIDCANIFIHALDNPSVSGPLNAVAPNPVQMKEFSSLIAKIIDRPSWLKVPDIALEAVIGEASLPVTEGIKVYPERTLASGFKFKYVHIADALQDLLK